MNLGKVKFNGDEMFKIAEYFAMKIDDIFLPTTHQNGEVSEQKEGQESYERKQRKNIHRTYRI